VRPADSSCSGQSSHRIAPTNGLYVVADTHVVHIEVPRLSLYVPISHGWHPPSGSSLLYPALHVQSVSSSLASFELVNVSEHVVHSEFPIVSLNVPASHDKHGVSPDP
jgi:hypothetical protein